MLDAGRVFFERPKRDTRRLEHLARLFKEDFAHFGVGLEPGRLDRRRGERHERQRRRNGRRRFQPDRVGRGGHEVGQRVGNLLACARLRAALGERCGHAVDGGLRAREAGGEFGLQQHFGLVREALEFARHLVQRRVQAGGRTGQRLGLRDERRLESRRRSVLEGRGVSTHLRSEQTAGRVEAEHRLGELRLHAKQVDEEAERAQVSGQTLEQRLLVARVLARGNQGIDVLAHAQHREHGLLQTEHGQHAAHDLKLRRHRHQHRRLAGSAEELVDGFLGLGQRAAQFMHDAAHRLTVGHSAVELLHPGFQRLRLGAVEHRVDALGQPLDAWGLFGVIEGAVFERGLQVEHAGGKLHRERRLRRAGRVHRLRDDRHDRVGQSVAAGHQALERIGHQTELLAEAAQAVHFPAGHRRP